MLRKVSSSNSRSPLKNTKMQGYSYGVNDPNNNTNNTDGDVSLPAVEHGNDNYDKTSKPPSSNTILGLNINLSHSSTGTSPPSGNSLNLLSPKASSSSLPPPFVIQVTAIASLGGVLFGYDMGVIAGALPQLALAFDLTDSQQELVVSILYVGGGLGAAMGGSLCDLVGRKPAILCTDLTFMVGACLLFTAPNLGALCLGRIVVGFAVAVSGIADVSYLHEIAPIQWRGAIVSVNEACISLGFLLAFIVGTVLTPSNEELENMDHPPRGWRYMFGLGGALAFVQFLGMWGMPESPVWLNDKGRKEEAKAALCRIQGGEEIILDEDDDELGENDYNDDEDGGDENDNSSSPQRRHKSPPRTPQDVAIQSKASYESLPSNATGPTTTISSVLDQTSRIQQFQIFLENIREGFYHILRVLTKYRRQVWIALFLSVCQQWCGQTSVLNYAPAILRAVVEQDGDGDDELSGWATLSIGLVKFIATVLVIWKIEYVGRRTLLLVGMGTIAFGLLLVAVAFSSSSPYMRSKNADEDGVVVQRGSGFYFALPGVLLVVSGYSMSFGPLTWLITSELFPTDIRGRALGFSTIVTYLCAAMVTYSFLTARSLLGTTAVFMIYTLITVLGMVFAALAIPDTGGKTQDEIDGHLSNMPWWRRFSGPESKRRRRASSSSRLTSVEDSPVGTVMSGTGRLVQAELT